MYQRDSHATNAWLKVQEIVWNTIKDTVSSILISFIKVQNKNPLELNLSSHIYCIPLKYREGEILQHWFIIYFLFVIQTDTQIYYTRTLDD